MDEDLEHIYLFVLLARLLVYLLDMNVQTSLPPSRRPNALDHPGGS